MSILPSQKELQLAEYLRRQISHLGFLSAVLLPKSLLPEEKEVGDGFARAAHRVAEGVSALLGSQNVIDAVGVYRRGVAFKVAGAKDLSLEEDGRAHVSVEFGEEVLDVI